MVEKKETSKDEALVKRVCVVNDSQGELKTQTTLELFEWDTSKMDGYKDGDVVQKGLNLSIRTLKVNKKYPKQRVDIDLLNPEVVDSLKEAIYKAEEYLGK